MKRIRIAIVIWVGLMGASVRADPAQTPEDIEDVPTPGTLAELLPLAGVASVSVDYGLIMTMRSEDGTPAGNTSYYHWSIKPQGEQLLFDYHYGFAGINGRHVHSRTVYSAKGEMIAYRQDIRFLNGRTHTTTAEIIDDETVVTTTVTIAEAEKAEPPKVSRLPAKHERGAVPAEWLPLILAYHIRQGSLGYRFETFNPIGLSDAQVNRVVCLGAEQAQIDGEDRRAHLLTIERAQEGNQSNILTRIKMLVSEDGEVLWMDSESGKYRLAYRRTTAEQIAERFEIDVSD